MISPNKTANLARFQDLYERLNESERNLFSEVCNKLLVENFIYGQEGHDVEEYRAIVRFKDAIECYFSLIDFKVYQNDDYKIFYLKSDIRGVRVKLRKLESVVLLILAKLYAIKSLEVNSTADVEVIVKSDDVVEEITKTRIYGGKLGKTDIQSALLTLKSYKIIDFKNVDDALGKGFKILPTILFIVKEKDLDIIEERLKGLSNVIDDEDEKGDEEDEIN